MKAVWLGVWFMFFAGMAVGIFIGAIIATSGAADMKTDPTADDRAWKAMYGWQACLANARISEALVRTCYSTDADGDSGVATESTVLHYRRDREKEARQ